MASTGISEFTYGFAFLYEQTKRNWSDLHVAPILPSLQEEADEGWDAHLHLKIGIDFYYQFKLSEYLSRGNAKYIKDGTYTSPYYRFELHKKENNRQHQRLKSLSATHPNVYYAAPEFSTLTEFNSSFLNSQILETSRIIPVTGCDPIYDGDQHHITFQTGNSDWLQHSEAIRHHRSITGREIEQVYRQTNNEWTRIDERFAHNLFSSITETIRTRITDERLRDRSITNLLDVPQNERTLSGYLRRSSQLVSIFYGLTLVLVGEGDSKPRSE